MARSKKQREYQASRSGTGTGQLSLVEHALCPLDPRLSLRRNVAFEYQYRYTDSARHQRTAQVRVICPAGLSASDEFFLWGLLALTFSQPEPDSELHATPHYCLRQLGVVDQRSRRGGRQYEQFSHAIDRLSLVRYQNDAFYDPIRTEHRRVSFGFFSYSLPLDPRSSRAWRIAWDPIFFEFARTTGGRLPFNLEIYQRLDPASRRLFLFASKLFARRSTTPNLDVRHLAVNVMGFQPTIATRDLKLKLRRCIATLIRLGVFKPVCDNNLFRKRSPGDYTLVLHRGGYFDHRPRHTLQTCSVDDSAARELLQAIGLDDGAIVRILRRYPLRVVREWADITLAAKERFGAGFFKRSPQAYFVDNVQRAAQGTRSSPDWWRDLRSSERRRHTSSQISPDDGLINDLSDHSRAVLERIRETIVSSACEVGTGPTNPAHPKREESRDLTRLSHILEISSLKKQ